MKRSCWLLSLCCMPLWMWGNSYWLDVNGTDPGLGNPGGGTWTWDSVTETWSTVTGGTTTGGSDPLVAWQSGVLSEVNFPAGSNYTVELVEDVLLLGIRKQGAGTTSGTTTVVSDGEDIRTITFAEGGFVFMGIGSGRNITLGNNINLVGDFDLLQSGSSNGGTFALQGTGAEYVGTVTLTMRNNNTGTMRVGGSSRFGTQTNLVLNFGTILVDGTTALGNLSGSGGVIRRNASTPELTINQSQDGSWAGVFGTENSNNSNVGLIKQGSGRLEFSGEVTHWSRGVMEVVEGSFFIRSGGTLESFSSGTDGWNELVVHSGATFGGGGVVVSRTVLLEGATSVLAPGDFDGVGTLTLGAGVDATLGGGRLRFRVNGWDEVEEENLSDFLEISGGEWESDGAVWVDIVNLDEGTMVSGNSVALISGAGLSGADWQVGTLPVGWEVGVDPFLVDDDTLYMTFTVIPEPGMVALLLGVFGLAVVRRSFLNHRGHGERRG